ncbi:hypothetical protein REPUB_Repub14bG0131800 [Reevesia pubescens]
MSNCGLPHEPYQFKVAYDKLVIAAGAEPLTFGIKGASDVFLAIDFAILVVSILYPWSVLVSYNHIINSHHLFSSCGLSLSLLRQTPHEDSLWAYQKRKRNASCTVLSLGVALQEWSSVANEILSSFDVGLRQYATNHLTKSGVHLMRRIVKEVHPKNIVLNDVTDVPYGLLVWSTGVGPSQFVKSLNLPNSSGGRIGVDEWLRVPSVEDVFALGDCAGLLEQRGKPVLPALAQVADRQGKYLVEVFNRIGKQDGGKENHLSH